MRSLFYISALLFSMSLTAQKTVIKEVDYKNQRVEIKLQDIDLLELIHTEEQKVSISMQDYMENPIQLDVKSDADVITISTKNITSVGEDSRMNKFCYEQPLFPSYQLMLPKDCDVEITFKNGNFSTQNFNGNLDLRLNTGDVTIGAFKGVIKTELFSGNVFATIENTEADIVTNQGKTTTSFSTNDWQKTDNSLKGVLGLKNNLLTIRSINANIMLNSNTTQ